MKVVGKTLLGLVVITGFFAAFFGVVIGGWVLLDRVIDMTTVMTVFTYVMCVAFGVLGGVGIVLMSYAAGDDILKALRDRRQR